MQSGVRNHGQSTFGYIFSIWWWGNDIEENNFNDCKGSYAIYVKSNYHSMKSLDKMYKSNCKEF